MHFLGLQVRRSSISSGRKKRWFVVLVLLKPFYAGIFVLSLWEMLGVLLPCKVSGRVLICKVAT
jgi:hypothetical protein